MELCGELPQVQWQRAPGVDCWDWRATPSLQALDRTQRRPQLHQVPSRQQQRSSEAMKSVYFQKENFWNNQKCLRQKQSWMFHQIQILSSELTKGQNNKWNCSNWKKNPTNFWPVRWKPKDNHLPTYLPQNRRKGYNKKGKEEGNELTGGSHLGVHFKPLLDHDDELLISILHWVQHTPIYMHR